MIAFAQFVIVFCIFLTLVAAYALFKGYMELGAFDKTLRTLPKDVPNADPFDGATKLGQRANEYAALFSTAAARNTLASFKVEHSSAPLQGYLRSMSSTPRNLVGVLILGGLLVTLFNLQGSVATLGATFRQLAEGQTVTSQSAADRDVREIQKAMGNIAQTAQNAFLRSGQVILTATVVLMLSLLLQRRGQTSSHQFRFWAEAAYLEALAQRPVDQQAQLLKFGELIDKMGSVIGSFEAIGSAMATAGDLGSKLEASSQMVAQAVTQLPSTINASVVQLSSEVTKDISVHLEHQIEHLKRILAIYGDQEQRVRKIQEYLDGFAKSSEATAGIVAGLKVLPDRLDSFTKAIRAANSSTEAIVEACKTLSAKVEDLPFGQLQSIVSELRATRLEMPVAVRAQIEPLFANFERRLPSLDNAQIAEEVRRLRGSVDNLPSTLHVERISSLLNQVNTLIKDGDHPTTTRFWPFRKGGN